MTKKEFVDKWIDCSIFPPDKRKRFMKDLDKLIITYQNPLASAAAIAIFELQQGIVRNGDVK